MERCIGCFVLAHSVLTAVLAVDETKTIDLGGLRQAKAALTVSEGEYEIKVRMLPVNSFDAATNARLNRDKAREVALMALAKHLSGEKSVEFVISGAQVEKAGTEGKSYSLTLRVPRKGVVVTRQGKSSKPGGDRVAFTSELFTRKRDYLNTLEQLTTTIQSELKMVEEEAKEQKEETDSIPAAVAKLKERYTQNFENIGKEINADLLLLSIEQEELAAALAMRKSRVLGQLKEAVKGHGAKNAKPKPP
jgi:hypothetical protein